MKYLGERGGKAEVNDAGRIRRLPFTGRGVPPEPGTRINPKRDSCCCPKQVELTPSQSEDKQKVDPRRQVAPGILKGYYSAKVVSADVLNLEVLNRQEGVYNFVMTSDRTWPSELIGKSYKFLVNQADGLPTPYPDTWVQWDCKKNEFSPIKIPHVKVIDFFLWSEKSFSEFRKWDKLFFGGTPSDAKPLKNPENLKVRYWILDVYRDEETLRRPITDGFTDRFDMIWRKNNWVPRVKETNPKAEVYGCFSTEGSLEYFLKWNRNPKNFNYERLY